MSGEVSAPEDMRVLESQSTPLIPDGDVPDIETEGRYVTSCNVGIELFT